jgi:synaptobrevin homolog YKT6
MKVISVIIARWRDGAAPFLLASEFNLSEFGYFARGSVKEVAVFVSREVISRAKSQPMMSVKHQEYVCHVRLLPTGLAAAVLTDQEYPARVAFSLLQSATDAFLKQYGQTKWDQISQDAAMTVQGLPELLTQYQKPEEADKIMRIQKELDETKTVLLTSIDQLLQRGEKLEELAQKSNDLSFQSKAFVDRATDLNSCCTIL